MTSTKSVKLPTSQWLMLALVALTAIVSLVDSPYPDLAPLQNVPTLFIAGGIALALRRWPLPDSAVACFTIFLLLHTLGGRYLYSYVPYDAWLEQLGLPSLSSLLGLHRNGYDRLVHLAFGLLFVHPISVLLTRHWSVRPGLAIYVAVEFVLAGSALYEIFEWLLTLVLAGPAADQYNGQQGDIWDSQKDMACAAGGAILCGVWLLLRRRIRSGGVDR
jgi:putative membrane protein